MSDLGVMGNPLTSFNENSPGFMNTMAGVKNSRRVPLTHELLGRNFAQALPTVYIINRMKTDDTVI